MKKIFSTIVIIITAVMCQAQIVLNLSRNEAIALGLKNRFDIKANRFDIQIAESNIKQTRHQWLPELSADGQIKYSPQLQNSVIPGGVIPGFDQTTQLPLMVSNESVFGLNLSQPIFNAAMINDTKLAKNQLALQQEKNHAVEIDIMLQISRSYLDAALRGLQKRIAADITERTREYEHIAEGMYKNGSLIENYYLRTRLDRENAEQLQQQADQDFALSLMQLRYQLNIQEDTPLKLTDSLEVNLSAYDKPNAERTEIRQLELIQQSNQLNLKKIQESVLPSVSFGANYSQQFLSNNFNYGTGNWWSPFSYLSLNMHVPVSAWFKNKAIVTEYRQRVSQHELLLAQKKADINYEVQQTQTALSNAVLNMINAKNSYELSKTIFHNQQEQYRLGVFDYSALLDTEKSLSTTEHYYIQSAYELMLAQIQIQKATNNFK